MTLKDVAVISGCSVATVCKVFKDSAEISDETKNTVLDAAKKCGYIKKATKRNAVLGGVKTIIIADSEQKATDKIYDINKALGRNKYISLYTLLDEKGAIQLMEQIGAAGIAVCGTIKSDLQNITSFSANDVSELSKFADTLDDLHPVRAPRNSAVNTKADITKAKKHTVKNTVKTLENQVPETAEKPEQPQKKELPKRKEEIWLL